MLCALAVELRGVRWSISSPGCGEAGSEPHVCHPPCNAIANAVCPTSLSIRLVRTDLKAAPSSPGFKKKKELCPDAGLPEDANRGAVTASVCSKFRREEPLAFALFHQQQR